MKALLASGGMVELGSDTRKNILRAGRLYRRGVFAKVILDEPVPTCGYRSGHKMGGYWTLVDAGLISRRCIPVRTCDGEYGGHDTIYEIDCDVEFTDTRGNDWKQGDYDEWLK